MTKSILTILLFISTFISFAQSSKNNNVVIDNSFHYSLSATSDVNSTYYLDLAALPFKNLAVKESYFGAISDNLLTYSFDKLNNVVTLKLNHYAGSKIVSVDQWNRYISENTTKYFNLYKEINK